MSALLHRSVSVAVGRRRSRGPAWCGLQFGDEVGIGIENPRHRDLFHVLPSGDLLHHYTGGKEVAAGQWQQDRRNELLLELLSRPEASISVELQVINRRRVACRRSCPAPAQSLQQLRPLRWQWQRCGCRRIPELQPSGCASTLPSGDTLATCHDPSALSCRV